MLVVLYQPQDSKHATVVIKARTEDLKIAYTQKKIFFSFE